MITPRVETAPAALDGMLCAIGGRPPSALASRSVTRLSAIQKASSVIVLQPPRPNPSVVNQPVQMDIFVEAGNEAPTGTVIITVSGGTETCTVILVSQNAHCAITLLAP